MPGDDGRKKVIGPMPTLFIGVGPCAQQALAELSRMTQSLTAPIQGPFGLVLMDSRGAELFIHDWPCAADVRMPEPVQLREASEAVGGDEEKLVTSLASLVRRLRSIEPGAEPAPGGHVRMNGYAAVDLSEAPAVGSTLRLLRGLRQVDAAVDVTVLGLTARPAANGSVDDNRWFETWQRLLEQLQDGPCAQRVYLLDGCDTDKTWLEHPEQLYRLAAEFLLYHGITCRNVLRQNERARTGVNETLLNVCGSFGCRTIPADLSVVAERVAERLAREDLAGLYQRTIPSGWLSSLQEQARLLVDRIATICDRGYQAQTSSGDRRDRPDARQSANAEIAEAVRKTIKYVCSREPLVSLCLFLQLLRPRLARLLSQQQLWERARTRQMATQVFRRQAESTYEPIRVWLSRSQTRWLDRFTPAPQEVPDVAMSRPAGLDNYLLGWLVLAAGLALVPLGISSRLRVVAVVGGWLSIAASVLMTLPVGWTRHPRHRLREGQEIQSSIRAVTYRKGASSRTRHICAALLVVGLAAVMWPWWPNAWRATTEIWAGGVVVMAGTGAVLLAKGPKETRPDQPSEAEAPGHANPPMRRHRAAGLLCLAVAWAVFCLGTPLSVAPGTILPRLALLVGLVLGAVRAGLALFPRVGHTYLVDRVAKMPQPLTGGIARPVKGRELPQGVTTLAAWVSHLVLDPDQCLEGLGATHARQGRETLLDFLATDWEGQFAQAFRREVEARSGKPLKTLALQPVLWAECILHQLQDPHAGRWMRVPPGDASRSGPRGELTSLFALQAVRAWIDSHTLTELLSFLDIDLARLGRLVGRLAPAHWPSPRLDPDMNTSVIAVGKLLWDAVAPLAKMRGAPAVVLLDWDSGADRIVVLRAVQGLAQGWRGFPGLPGQFHGDPPQSEPSSPEAGALEPSQTLPVPT